METFCPFFSAASVTYLVWWLWWWSSSSFHWVDRAWLGTLFLFNLLGPCLSTYTKLSLLLSLSTWRSEINSFSRHDQNRCCLIFSILSMFYITDDNRFFLLVGAWHFSIFFPLTRLWFVPLTVFREFSCDFHLENHPLWQIVTFEWSWESHNLSICRASQMCKNRWSEVTKCKVIKHRRKKQKKKKVWKRQPTNIKMHEAVWGNDNNNVEIAVRESSAVAVLLWFESEMTELLSKNWSHLFADSFSMVECERSKTINSFAAASLSLTIPTIDNNSNFFSLAKDEDSCDSNLDESLFFFIHSISMSDAFRSFTSEN